MSIFQPRTDIYGSASFMGFWERRRLLNTKNKGLVIDGVHRISEKQSFMHCVVAAPSGRGKTSRFVIPNVLWANGQSMVITDPAGEVYETCSDYLTKQGYLVKKLNVQNLNQSDFYNPLKRTLSHGSIRKLCTILVESQLSSTSGDPFWNHSAIALLVVLVKCIKTLPAPAQNLTEIYRMLNLILSDQDHVTNIMRAQLDADTLNEYLGFVKQEKTLDSIIGTAKAALHAFSDPKIEKLTSTDTIDFEQLRERPTALFLMVPDKDASSLMFLLTLFYSQLFSFCMSPPTTNNYLPIYLLLDEFGNLSKIPNFSTAITTLRKWDVSVTILIQDIQQIAKTYGADDLSIILNGGCSSRLIFPGLSPETCSMVEKMLGNKTVIHRKYDPAEWNLIGQREDFNEVGRPLLTATEINQLRDDQLLFFHANKKPVLLKTKPWWKEKTLKKRGKNK